MYQNNYFVSKSSGTYADTLAAYGLAAVLAEVLQQARGRGRRFDVTLSDAGPYYQISLQGGPLTEAEIEKCQYFSAPGDTGFFITSSPKSKKEGGDEGDEKLGKKRKSAKPKAKKETKPKPAPVVPDGVKTENVDAMWDRVRQFSARRSELRDAGIRGTDLENQLKDSEPPPYWPVVTWIGDYRMQAEGGYNGLLEQWATSRKHFIENLKTLLALHTLPDAEVGDLAEAWGEATGHTRRSEREVTAPQLLNPHKGKGLNQPKPNSVVQGKARDCFWLIEYLRACGLWLASAPRSASGERKTYVLSPLKLTLADHAKVFREFSRRLWNQAQRDQTSLKLDITSVLLYLETLLDYSEAAQKGTDDNDFGVKFDTGFGPEQVVSGLHVVQFKLLSRNAYTMTHMGFLALPRWTAWAKTREEVYAIKEVIQEHLKVIQSIDEGNSDGYDLLRRYRSFVAGGSWEAFFDFAHGYANFVIREMNAGRRPWTFSANLLRRLMMNADKPDKSLTRIIESRGFQNVAYAIRHSTVVPQGQVARAKQGKGERPLYDVRYGLGQSLKQKSNDAKEFLAALGNFISNYSAETYQVFENKGQRRRSDVQVSDLDEVTRLVVEFGPEVVCNLLVAYGYASDFPTKDDADKAGDDTSQ